MSEVSQALYLDLLKKALTDYLHIDNAYANGAPSEHWTSKSALNNLRNKWLIGLLRRSHLLVLKEDRLTPAERRRRREGGLDWPLMADTMIGLKRLDNLQSLCTAVIRYDVPGDFIETGVWRCGASILMRAVLKVHGITDRLVWACDSFEGLPPPDPEKHPADQGDIHHTF